MRKFYVIGVAAALVLGALAAASTISGSRLSQGSALGPPSFPTPSPRQLKDNSPAQPAGPSQTPAPRWPARTPADVLRGIVSDRFYQSVAGRLKNGPDADPRVAGRTLLAGTPVFVRGIEPNRWDEYIVPIQAGGTILEIVVVSIDRNGMGIAASSRGWSKPSFPTISEALARDKGSASNDSVATAELVWAYVSPMQAGSFADADVPLWRLTRLSGAVFYLFEDGNLVLASKVTLGH